MRRLAAVCVCLVLAGSGPRIPGSPGWLLAKLYKAQLAYGAADSKAKLVSPVDAQFARNFRRDFNAKGGAQIRQLACIHVPATKTTITYEDCIVRFVIPGHRPVCGYTQLSPTYDNPYDATYGGKQIRCSLFGRIYRNVQAAVSRLAA